MAVALRHGRMFIITGWATWVVDAIYIALLDWWSRPRQHAFVTLDVLLFYFVVFVGWALILIGTPMLGHALFKKGGPRTRGNIAIFRIGLLGVSAPGLVVLGSWLWL